MRIFDKEKYIKNMGVPIGCAERWVNECDGKKVVRVEEEDETYQVVGLPYNVAKVWTKEVNDIKTLEELGYKKFTSEDCVMFVKDLFFITFVIPNKSVVTEYKYGDYNFPKIRPFELSMEELKAIYKYCEDLGWI